ncbi:hypothetical protein FJZ22_01475 [Candidatus Pacearchaeota archaeon]|nr:hypothetical protein [Candidatus Pacearchaeota archaeon]
MKIAVIGDPHGEIERVREMQLKDIKAIIINGDLGKCDIARKQKFSNLERTAKGLPERIYSAEERERAFLESYETALSLSRYLASIAQTYTIYGNVENVHSKEKTEELSSEIGKRLPLLEEGLYKEGCKVFNNEILEVAGKKIGGLEYFTDTLENEKRAQKILERMERVDLLITHQPPYGSLDKLSNPNLPAELKGKRVGSRAIRTYIETMQPAQVFCGHVHEGEGKEKIGKTEVYNLGFCGYKIVEI